MKPNIGGIVASIHSKFSYINTTLNQATALAKKDPKALSGVLSEARSELHSLEDLVFKIEVATGLVDR